MENIGDPAIDLGTIGAVVVFCFGLAVGLGGMWLAWRIVRRLPIDDARQAPADDARQDKEA